MGLKIEEFQDLFRALLPRGKAFEGERYQRFVDGLAIELARVDERAAQLTDEFLPDSSNEILSDWMRIFGVHSRAVVLGKLAMTGGQSRQHYQDLIERTTNAEVTIREFKPLVAGSATGSMLYGAHWRFVFEISGIPATQVEAVKLLIEDSRPAHTFVVYRGEGGHYV